MYANRFLIAATAGTLVAACATSPPPPRRRPRHHHDAQRRQHARLRTLSAQGAQGGLRALQPGAGPEVQGRRATGARSTTSPNRSASQCHPDLNVRSAAAAARGRRSGRDVHAGRRRPVAGPPRGDGQGDAVRLLRGLVRALPQDRRAPVPDARAAERPRRAQAERRVVGDAARRALPEGRPSLPYVVVYGKGGKQVRAVAGLDLAALDRAIAEASRR